MVKKTENKDELKKKDSKEELKKKDNKEKQDLKKKDDKEKENNRLAIFEEVLKNFPKSKSTNEDVVSIFTKISSDVKKVSSGSMILNNILGGGIPVGRIIEIYGPEASGKTSIALTTLANVQKEGGNCVFIDAEQAFDPVYAKKLGVNLDKLGYSNLGIAESVFSLILKLILTDTVDFIVVDSVASLVPSAEIDADPEKASVGTLARVMSKMIKQLLVPARQHNCTVVFLNQERDKIGTFIPTKETSGGKALKYYASQRIEINKKSVEKDENGEIIGTLIKMKVVKNKVAQPYKEGLTVLTFNQGINQLAELLTVALEKKVIVQSGRTYHYKPLHEIKNIEEKIKEINEKYTNTDYGYKIGVDKIPVMNELKKNKWLYDNILQDVLKVINETIYTEETSE